MFLFTSILKVVKEDVSLNFLQKSYAVRVHTLFKYCKKAKATFFQDKKVNKIVFINRPQHSYEQ